MSEHKQSAPSQISPYVSPVLLSGFSLWSLYDGWIIADPEMLKHQLFNRIASGVLLVWAILDTAHAVTNLTLALFVYATENWHYW